MNYNYIISELCVEKDNPENMCLGKCHLSNEIKKQIDHENEKQKIVILENIKVPHITSTGISDKYVPNSLNTYFLDNDEYILINQIKPLVPPPKISLELL